MTDKELVENCYKRMYQGMIDKDCEVLSDVLDESFVLMHMTGMGQSKDVFIRAVENGTLNYYSADHQRIETEIHEDNAKLKADLCGQSVVSAAVFGGGRHTWRLQLKLKLIKTADVWKITDAIASTY